MLLTLPPLNKSKPYSLINILKKLLKTIGMKKYLKSLIILFSHPQKTLKKCSLNNHQNFNSPMSNTLMLSSIMNMEIIYETEKTFFFF
jgi:hypothetical protein